MLTEQAPAFMEFLVLFFNFSNSDFPSSSESYVTPVPPVSGGVTQ